MKNNITTGSDAISRMLRGIKTATSAIRLSYGANGVNASVERDIYPYCETANDAQTIIQSVFVDDSVEKIGLNYLKELSDKANKDSGDGRKTTCIIAEVILEEGYKSGLSGMKLKKELDRFIPLIESEIDALKDTITESDVHKVATVAGESEEIGNLIGDIYKKIGKEGIIQVEGSGLYTTYYDFIEGVRFQGTGYLSPSMVHDEEARKEGRKESRAVYYNPTILVTKRKISHLNDINPLLEKLSADGKKDLVIFTDDMDSGVASIMVKAHQDRVLNILIIKAPVMFKNYIFEDFAKVVGATIVEDATGINYKNLEMKHLGTCGKIVVDKEETIVTGIADISSHLAELKDQGDNDSLLRVSWLTTKTAILKLGANNESELSYKRLKTEDAINSSRLALRDGVVEGGGICLSKVADRLEVDGISSILIEALKAPLRQNLLNMGIDNPNWSADIQDAAAVVKNAVRNAIALATTVLTSGIVINIPKKTPEEIAAMSLQTNRMRF